MIKDIVEISEQLSNKITAKYYNAGTKSAFVGLEEKDDFVLMTPCQASMLCSASVNAEKWPCNDESSVCTAEYCKRHCSENGSVKNGIVALHLPRKQHRVLTLLPKLHCIRDGATFAV